MDEIKVYLDREKTEEVKGEIEFEGVVAGKVSKGSIYIYNTIGYYINIEILLKGENIEISKTIKRIAPKKTEEVEFIFTPKLTTMKPIEAKLKIKVEYVIT